jgi:hypothetical protein
MNKNNEILEKHADAKTSARSFSFQTMLHFCNTKAVPFRAWEI